MQLRLTLVAAALYLAPGTAWAACPSPRADQIIALQGRPFAAAASPDNCTTYVSLITGAKSGAVAVLANEAGIFHTARSISLPRGSGGGLALSHHGTLLAVPAEDAIVLIDPARFNTPGGNPVIATIPDVGRGAIYAQFSIDDATLFVSEERNASILVISVARAVQGLSDHGVIGRVPVGQAPVGLALSPDGATLYSTSQVLGSGAECKAEQPGGAEHARGALIAIDAVRAASNPKNHAVAAVVRAGCNPVRVAVSRDGRSLWVSARGDDRVLGIDASSLRAQAARTQMTAVSVGPSPVGVAIRPDGAQLWVANSDRFATAPGSLTLVTPADPAQAQASGSLPVGAFPRDLRFMADGRTLLVALFGASALMIYPTEDLPAPR